MMPTKPRDGKTAAPPLTVAGPSFRSAAVARLAEMPVATLRIWEQRHQAVRPVTAESGHRLYSPADLQRVLLLRQLTGQGHAIGSIAALSDAELQGLSQPVACVRQAPGVRPGAAPYAGARPGQAFRLAVVGAALAARVQRPAVARHLAHAVPRVLVFDSLADVVQAGDDVIVDLLLWHAPALRAELPRDWLAARQSCRARQAAVVYRFAGAAATRALAAAGAATLREPSDDEALGTWLASVQAALPRPAKRRSAGNAAVAPGAAREPGTLAPRRYADEVLTTIAGLSSSLTCECPRHVAELLMQLSSFEAYSAGCIHRDSADAQLHAYLQQVAGASRALFEAALERVARHEGLPLR